MIGNAVHCEVLIYIYLLYIVILLVDIIVLLRLAARNKMLRRVDISFNAITAFGDVTGLIELEKAVRVNEGIVEVKLDGCGIGEEGESLMRSLAADVRLNNLNVEIETSKNELRVANGKIASLETALSETLRRLAIVEEKVIS